MVFVQDYQFKIILVEDEVENREVLSELLKDHGYEVKAFGGGRAAIEAARAAPPDLLLLDINMPEMDGFQVCEIFKKDPELSDIPIIFISALLDTQKIIRSLRVGGADYISKPFHFEEVEARIKVHLQIVQERRRTEALLLNVLPEKIIQDLKDQGKTEPEFFEDITILFADIVGFTRTTASTPAQFLIKDLNELFTAFDEILEQRGCQRIKTIGDGYLAVGGNPTPGPEQAAAVVSSGIDMLNYVTKRNGAGKLRPGSKQWEVRIGVHTGGAVGAVVGTKKYAYDLIGDGVNTASRVQTACEPMELRISESTHQMVEGLYPFTACPPVDLKGKGSTLLYTYHPAGDSDSRRSRD
jgi:class 3 adenylate cyclase